MKKETFVLKETFKAKPSRIYNAWLDSELHGEMTGGEASCSNFPGDTFTAWDGYITGKNIDLLENQKIVQSWRTAEFDEKDEDSIVTIELEQLPDGNTALTLTHTNIPEGQTQYKEGWADHYFSPMKEYFNE